MLITFPAFSIEQEKVLEAFFRTLIADSEAGYVMYGAKPVCIMGFSIEDKFNVENELHRMDVDLFEGVKVWKELKPQNENLIIHVYEEPDSLVPQYKHLLVINRGLFFAIVQKNLSLFQYILGPEVTPSSLLTELLKPNSTWHSTLKDSKVLIGILLGFGTNNSIYESRLEALQDYLFQGENIPFKGKVEEFGISNQMFRDMILVSASRKVTERILPSFGFKTLKEEYSSLLSKLEASSTALVRDKPGFIFGRIKNDPETKPLIEKLEATQKRIQNLLNSKTFLSDVLKEFQCANTLGNTSTESLDEYSKLIAAHIWDILEDDDGLYQDNFLIGMESDRPLDDHEFDYRKNEALSQISQNLEKTTKLFQQLDTDANYLKIIPDKLYFKILKSGQGECLKGATNTKLSYAIYDDENNILVEKRCQLIDLNEVVPGLALGVIGMSKGEIREIVIHPCLSYGLNTSFEKGISFNAVVQLHEFGSTASPYNYQEFDMTIQKIDDEEACKTKAFNEGFNMWSHYGKYRHYTLSEVLELISKFRKGEDHKKYLNRDRLNTLHWIIYHDP